jgi:hypothetical protein
MITVPIDVLHVLTWTLRLSFGLPWSRNAAVA